LTHEECTFCFEEIYEHNRFWWIGKESVVVEFKTHSIFDFVIFEGDLIFVDCVPLLNSKFFRAGACLSRDNTLEITHGVIRVALDTNFLAETVIEDDLNHF